MNWDKMRRRSHQEILERYGTWWERDDSLELANLLDDRESRDFRISIQELFHVAAALAPGTRCLNLLLDRGAEIPRHEEDIWPMPRWDVGEQHGNLRGVDDPLASCLEGMYAADGRIIVSKVLWFIERNADVRAALGDLLGSCLFSAEQTMLFMLMLCASPDRERLQGEGELYSLAVNCKSVQLLICAEVDVNATLEWDATPLHRVIDKDFEDSFEAFKALLDAGADITRKGRVGNSLLHEAIEQSDWEVFDFLIDLPGYDINQRNDAGQTVLQILEEPYAHEIWPKNLLYVEKLRKRGAE